MITDAAPSAHCPSPRYARVPPTHAGKGVTHKLFASVEEVLAEDGTFWLVANRIMDYDEFLSTEFGFETGLSASSAPTWI